MAAKKAPKLEDLAKYADEIRSDLAVPRQNDVFRAATEAGFLAANADGTVDDDEKKTLVDAVGLLSKGAVIEWEADTLIEEAAVRLEKDGAEKRHEAVGGELKTLGQPEAALLFAAFVAQASGGIDKDEAAVLHAIGKGAGIAKNKITALLKRVGATVD
jgi:tellurite resistance protein